MLEEPEYEDAAFLLYLRCVIEVLPDDALVELDITDLVGSGYIDKASLPRLCDEALDSLRTRIELDYLIFGYALRDDPQLDEKMRARIERLLRTSSRWAAYPSLGTVGLPAYPSESLPWAR